MPLTVAAVLLQVIEYDEGDTVSARALKDAATPTAATATAISDLRLRFPRPFAFSCAATQVPVDSFQTERYVLFICDPDLIAIRAGPLVDPNEQLT
ncbi:hypothetical protein SCB29_29495 [Paraburkholderia sp. SIMBA_055]